MPYASIPKLKDWSALRFPSVLRGCFIHRKDNQLENPYVCSHKLDPFGCEQHVIALCCKIGTREKGPRFHRTPSGYLNAQTPLEGISSPVPLGEDPKDWLEFFPANLGPPQRTGSKQGCVAFGKRGDPDFKKKEVH